MAQRQARAVREQGQAQASRIGAAGRQAASSALAAMAGRGAIVEGPLAASAANAAMDATQARANAAMQAWGFEAESATWNARRKAAKTGIGFGVAGALLGGAGAMTSALTKV